MPSYSITQPAPYVLAQVWPFAAANNLFENDRQLKNSFEEEHGFSTGVHDHARIANEVGLFTWNGSVIAATWSEGLDGTTPISRASAGKYTVLFDGAYTTQDFTTIVGASGIYETGAAAEESDVPRKGWAWNGSNKDRIDLWFKSQDGATFKDPWYFSVVVFGA